MLIVATCFWRQNWKTAPASRGYEPYWVNRLYRGFERNLTVPFQFVVFTDREYGLDAEIEQLPLSTTEPGWEAMIEPFQIEGPAIIVGLDSVVTGNCDALAEYCFNADRIALPLSPGKDFACNAVVLKPRGHTDIFTTWNGENDMEWLRTFPHEFIDQRFPGQVQSYKCHIRPNGLGDTRIAYMHGRPKADELGHLDWIKRHWV